jgi:OmpA-OmpF porin, OOP family
LRRQGDLESFMIWSLVPAGADPRCAWSDQRAANQAPIKVPADACDVRFTVLSQTGAIQFKSGSTIIEPASEAVLNSAADIANRCGGIKFDVVGHTDNVGDARTNLQLSLDRAKWVSAYLQSKGVSAARIQTKGFGRERHIKSNDTEAGRAANRRIEFEFRKE